MGQAVPTTSCFCSLSLILGHSHDLKYWSDPKSQSGHLIVSQNVPNDLFWSNLTCRSNFTSCRSISFVQKKRFTVVSEDCKSKAVLTRSRKWLGITTTSVTTLEHPQFIETRINAIPFYLLFQEAQSRHSGEVEVPCNMEVAPSRSESQTRGQAVSQEPWARDIAW